MFARLTLHQIFTISTISFRNYRYFFGRFVLVFFGRFVLVFFGRYVLDFFSRLQIMPSLMKANFYRL